MVLLEKAGRTKERESDAVERERERSTVHFFSNTFSSGNSVAVGSKTERSERERKQRRIDPILLASQCVQ